MRDRPGAVEGTRYFAFFAFAALIFAHRAFAARTMFARPAADNVLLPPLSILVADMPRRYSRHVGAVQSSDRALNRCQLPFQLRFFTVQCFYDVHEPPLKH